MAAYHACWDLNYYGLIERRHRRRSAVDHAQRVDPHGVPAAGRREPDAGACRRHPLARRSGGARRCWSAAALRSALEHGSCSRTYLAYFGVLHVIALCSLLALPFVVLPLWVGVLVAAVVAARAGALFSPMCSIRSWLDWIGFFKITPGDRRPGAGVPVVRGDADRRARHAAAARPSPAFTWTSRNRAVRALGFARALEPACSICCTSRCCSASSRRSPTGCRPPSRRSSRPVSRKAAWQSCGTGQGKAEGAGAAQFCTAYCHCALDMTVENDLWNAPQQSLKDMSALCTAMSE